MSNVNETSRTREWNRAYGAALQAVVVEVGWNAYRVFDARKGKFRTRGKLDGHSVTLFTDSELTFVLSRLWRERESEGPTPDPVEIADKFVKYMDVAGAL